MIKLLKSMNKNIPASTNTNIFETKFYTQKNLPLKTSNDSIDSRLEWIIAQWIIILFLMVTDTHINL